MTANLAVPAEVPRYVARKFAHLAVVGNDVKSLHGAIDFLVQQVLLDKGSGGLKSVRQNFEEVFLLKFEKDEIDQSLQRLVATGDVIEKQGFYTLETKKEGLLKKLNADTRVKEREIYNAWISDILHRYPELTEENQSNLIDDLKVYLYRLFLQNGVDCVTYINPGRKTTSNTGAYEELFNLLPTRSKKLADIRRIEFPRFLKDADTERRIYFANLLDGTFVYQIIQIDPESLKIVRKNLKNYVLYLDTNILYSLLGLKDSRQSSAIEKSLALARGLGIKFVVSTRTVEEMRHSIEAQTAALLSSPSVRRSLAEIGADMSEEESLTTAYWRSYAKTGISKEDFIERFRNIADLLSNKQVNIVKETFRPVAKSIRAEKVFLNSTITVKKSDSVAEHDAYHYLLISHLREQAAKTNNAKRYWFLSWDNQLALYAEKKRKEGEVSFMYLPHQLVQILRLYTQRTADYDETFLDLFARPQIKSAQNVVSNDFAEKVLAKVSSFADLPEELAVKIMLDSGFISNLANKSSSEFDKEVEKEIDTRVNRQLQDLAGRIKELEEREAKRKIEQDEVASTAQNTIGGRDRTIRILKTSLFVLALFCLALVNLLMYLFFWDKIPMLCRYALVSVDLALIVLSLRIKWKMESSLSIVASVAGLIGFVFFVVPLLSKSEVKTEPTTDINPTATTTTALEEVD